MLACGNLRRQDVCESADDGFRRILLLRARNMWHVQWFGGLVEKASGMSRMRLHSEHFGSRASKN